MSWSHAKSRGFFRKFIRWIELDRRDVLSILIYSGLAGLLSLIVPLASQALIGNLAYKTSLQPTFILALATCVLLGFSSLMQSLETFLVEIFQRRIFTRTAINFSDIFAKIKHSALQENDVVELANRFLEVSFVQKNLSGLLLEGLSLLLQIFVGMMLLAFYHPYLLAFDIVLIIFLLCLVWPMGLGAVQTSLSESYKKYEVLSWLEEIAAHPSLFRSKIGFDFALNQTLVRVRDYLEMRSLHFRILFRQYVGAYILQVFTASCLLGLGGWLVVRGELTIAQLVAVELVVSGMIASFAKLGKYLEQFYDLAASLDKIEHVLTLEVLDSGSHQVSLQTDDALAVELIHIAYSFRESGSEYLLKDISLTFPKATKTMIWASQASGKTTLGEIMAGTEPPQKGYVKINGIDLRQLSVSEIHEKIFRLCQVDFFKGSILDNLLIGQTADPSKVGKVLHALKLEEKILSLPEGLETEFKIFSQIFSKSESVLMMFARVLLSSAKFIIVDSLFDHLPPASQKDVMTAFDTFLPDATLVLLCTEPADVKVDQRFSLRDGYILNG